LSPAELLRIFGFNPPLSQQQAVGRPFRQPRGRNSSSSDSGTSSGSSSSSSSSSGSVARTGVDRAFFAAPPLPRLVHFPSSVRLKKAYEMIGNSISASVAMHLIWRMDSYIGHNT
jgi:hypothetical protein